MTPRDIIASAWGVTTREPAVRRWALAGSFLEMLLDLKLLSYQAYLIHSYLITGRGAGFFDWEIWLYENLPLAASLSILITFGTMVLVELFVPHLCRGAIIGLVAKSYKGDAAKGGLVLALYNFFPLFAIHEFLFLSGWTTILTIGSLTLRYIQDPIRTGTIAMLIFLFLLTNLLKFFFSFADQAVVVKKMGIFGAISRSFKLVVSHLSQIMFIILLLIVISIRILINAAVIVVIPAVIVGLTLLLTLVFSETLSIVIASIIGIGLAFLTSYFLAYLTAFKSAVWTITFMEFDKHKDLDVIE